MLEHQRPLIAHPRCLMLELAQRNDVKETLHLIVNRIAESQSVALVRIWLLDNLISDTFRQGRDESGDNDGLRLAASAGISLRRPANENASHFDECPIEIADIKSISASGEPLEIHCLDYRENGTGGAGWLKDEGVRGFGGQPLVHRDRVLGVLGVYSRGTIGEEDFDWMRTIADHAAASLANAVAWDEIQALRSRLEKENEYLHEQVREEQSFGEIIGFSAAIRKVTDAIGLVAPTNSTVLITGESGTGKELVAREIHRRSARSDKPLIKVNCAAIPHELYDSEFFGHLEGSFTGAVRDRVGRFGLANGGTLFLDEVGEIPLDLQSKLLRVIQEGEFERVGSEQTQKVDVRIVAATNRNLMAESEAGRFRADLYYRLSVFPIETPPLAQRREDIPLIAEHVLSGLARRIGSRIPKLTPANIAALKRYSWPGNVRELQHVLERALITCQTGSLELELIDETTNQVHSTEFPSEVDGPHPILTEQQIRDWEARNIRLALTKTKGKVSGADGAAAMLEISPTTLTSRMKQLGIRRK